MFSFRKKKRVLYPSVYSEWILEFKRMDAALIGDEEAALLRGGGLKDCKYCIEYFKRELTLFLEKQIHCYFQEVSDVVRQYVEENDCEYLILMLRRYHLRYQHLYFFADFDFLNQDFKDSLQKTLREKLHQYDDELITYFNEIAPRLDAMGEISTTIKRLIEI